MLKSNRPPGNGNDSIQFGHRYRFFGRARCRGVEKHLVYVLGYEGHAANDSQKMRSTRTVTGKKVAAKTVATVVGNGPWAVHAVGETG